MLNFIARIVLGIIIIGIAYYLMQVSEERAVCEKYCLTNQYDDYSFSPKYKTKYNSTSISTCTCKKNNELPDIFSLDEILKGLKNKQGADHD